MIFGISETKRTVRNREVSVRRGYTVQSNLSIAAIYLVDGNKRPVFIVLGRY